MIIKTYTAEVNGVRINFGGEIGGHRFMDIEVANQRLRLTVKDAEALFNAWKMINALAEQK